MFPTRGLGVTAIAVACSCVILMQRTHRHKQNHGKCEKERKQRMHNLRYMRKHRKNDGKCQLDPAFISKYGLCVLLHLAGIFAPMRFNTLGHFQHTKYDQQLIS